MQVEPGQTRFKDTQGSTCSDNKDVCTKCPALCSQARKDLSAAVALVGMNHPIKGTNYYNNGLGISSCSAALSGLRAFMSFWPLEQRRREFCATYSSTCKKHGQAYDNCLKSVARMDVGTPDPKVRSH